MRPLTLSFEGLRSYPAFGPVDFSGKNLVAILGDTGAGKSTILEALCVALYGKCSWSDKEVRDLIADGAKFMSVDLTFLHGGERWQVRRTFFANTMPTTALLENLDTKAKFDGVTRANEQVVHLLRLDFTAFRSAVLLPQGRFQTLLHASGRERTDLLKGIFGADAVEAVRDVVGERRGALHDLVHEADVARAGLRPDPAGAAEAALTAAVAAEARRDQLAATLQALRAAQRTAAGTVAAVTRLRAAGDAATAAMTDLGRSAPPVVDAATAAAAELAEVARGLDARERRAVRQRRAAETVLDTAREAGEGPDELGRAAATLGGLAGRLDDLRDLAAGADREAARLAAERARLDAAESEEPALAERAESLEATTKALSAHLDAVRAGVAALREHVREAVEAAVGAGTARSVRDRLAGDVAGAEKELPALADAATTARAALDTAGEALLAAHRSEAAATAGAHLHAGDACPVCSTVLTEAYLPPAPADPAALDAAATAERRARKQADTVAAALQDAGSRLGELRRRAGEAGAAVTAADARAASATGRLSLPAALAAVPPLPEVDGIVAPVPVDAVRHAEHCASVVDGISGEADAAERRAAVERLVGDAVRFEDAVRAALGVVEAAAAAARDALTHARAEHRAARVSLERDEAALATSGQRVTEGRAAAERDVAGLPAAVAAVLPPAAADLGPWAEALGSALSAARAVLAERRTAVEESARRLREAVDELAAVAADRLAVSTRTEAEVAAPLRRLLRRAEQASAAVTAASRELAELAPGAETEVPAVPDALTPESVATYVRDVATALAEVAGRLAASADGADERAAAQVAELGAALAAALPADAAPAAGSAADLLESAALDPVTAAAGTAEQQARQWRAEEAAARAEVPRAEALDAARAAGRARLAALDECRTLLTDGKFPGYLVRRRTRSLLGVASELFSRLSGEQFGFAEDFRVVSRRTGVARTPKTLSGGETFLASLALALALVELYGRTGGRLGALFLDEGFGSLDVGTLETALEVLRAEAGGDKLVAVISHLHAVAEAVDDVLWVEKQAGGSTARWLDAAETESLVRDDAAAGLLSLA